MAAATACSLSIGCSRSQGHGGAEPVARYQGGQVSNEELAQALAKLPPVLRERFETSTGRQDLLASLVDKKLLVQEAERRGLHEDPELARQVRELRERLLVQALLAAEERRTGPPTEAELRAYFEAHRLEFQAPEQVRVRRLLIQVPAGAPASVRREAREKLARVTREVSPRKGFEALARELGQGPERARGGDLGFLARGGGAETALEEAALALQRPGQLSGPLDLAEGVAVVQLVERRAPRPRTFEEARGEVGNRLAATRSRKAFDTLVAGLRSAGDVKLAAGPGNR